MTTGRGQWALTVERSDRRFEALDLPPRRERTGGAGALTVARASPLPRRLVNLLSWAEPHGLTGSGTVRVAPATLASQPANATSATASRS